MAGRKRPPRRQGAAGWLFVSPTIVVLGLFLLVPVLMALWVSFSDWFALSNVQYIGSFY